MNPFTNDSPRWEKNTHGILSAFNERVNHSTNFPHVGGKNPGSMNLGELHMV
jgi:hypothetical protein